MASRLVEKFKDKIEERHSALQTGLVAGNIPDWVAYKDTVGYLRGLRDAATLLEEAEKELSE